MPEPSVPRDGDVVVRQATLDGIAIYILAVVPGPDQYYVKARDRAVAQAFAFAALSGARTWFAEGAGAPALLTAVPVPVRPSAKQARPRAGVIRSAAVRP